MNLTPEVIEELSLPFPKDVIEIKAGATNQKAKGGIADKALALAYADPRAYQDRLDLVVGPHNWTVSYTPLEGKAAFICRLTVCGVSKEDVGESGPDENAHTSAAMQSFKRACSAFGIGRYLYHLPNTKWVAYDGQRKTIPQDEQQKVIDWFYNTARLQVREPRPMYPVETVANLDTANEKIEPTPATSKQSEQAPPRVETKPTQYKHLKKDGMDTDTLVRKATAYQREKADHLAESQGYVFNRPLNEYNEIEMRHIIDFLEGKREYHRVSNFIRKADTSPAIVETIQQENTQRDNLIAAYLELQKQITEHNIEPTPRLERCLLLDVEVCPLDHLQMAIEIMGQAITDHQAKPAEVIDVAIPALVGEWARQVRPRLVQEDVKFDQWTTGMICQFLAESVHHAKDHTELKSIVPFDPAEVAGLTPQAIYEKIIEKTKELDRCRQIILAGDRAGIQGKTARSTTVKK